MKSGVNRTLITSQECLTENLIPNSKIIYYMCHIVYDKYPRFRFPLYLLLKCLKRMIQRTTFDVEIVPAEYIKRLTFNSKFIDVNNCVVINSTFFKFIFNASQYIKFAECHRIAQAIPGLNPPNTILISENTNLRNKLKAKIGPVNGKEIKIASLVDISLISSPTAISNSATDQILKSYFNTPKLLYKDDLILVDLKDYGPEFYYTNLKLNQIDSISFKCNKIEEGGVVDCLRGYFCVTSGTTLKQSMDIQEFLPKKSRILTESDDPVDCLLEICPKGLQKYVNQLEAAIRPFILIKKINLMPNFLMQGGKGSGKNLILSSLAAKMGLKLCRLSTPELNANAYAQTEVKMRNAFFRAKVSAPCIVSIEHFEDVCRNNEGQYDPRILHYFRNEVATLLGNNELPVILVCVSNSKDLPTETSKLFLETVNVEAPNQSERSEILQWIVRKKSICSDVDLATVASKTHGFLFEDLQTLVYHSEKKSILDDRDVTLEDFDYALDIMQSSYTESLGAPKVPKVRWSDVGGLDDVKREIIKTITLPLKQSKLWKASGLKRSGLLLYGPPGTGKTLMAKAVATECGLCFLSVKGPELLNMYVGQSEKNVREVFEKARQASPCIIFFDELDSLAPNRGIAGDSGGVMDRVVSQLLAEMDGLNENGTLFVIGATNRPDLIDPALLRPGRFDKLLYVGPCTDVPSKIGVLQALTIKFNLSANVHLKKVVEMCPIYITGADLYGVCSDAWNSAAHRLIESIRSGKCDNLEVLSEKDVIVTMDDFKCAINKAKPSVSRADLVYYENLEQELSAKK